MEKKYKKPILRNIFKYIYTNKGNCIIGITGRVRTGKSHFAVKLGNDFDSKFKLEDSLVYNVEDLITRTLSFVKIKGKPLTLEEIQKIPNIRDWLKSNIGKFRIRPGKVIIFDEAGTGAYVREFFSQDNKTISKIVQIWAFLRLLTIVVVPEDLRLAESTLIKFMNLEIQMLGVSHAKRQAQCIAWEHIGWNKKTRDAIKRRVKGCRNKGLITVKPLDEEIGNVYEDLSKAHKLQAIIDMGRQYQVDKVSKVSSTKTIWDDIQHVKKNIEEYKNDRGQITIAGLQAKLGLSYHKASQIRHHLLSHTQS